MKNKIYTGVFCCLFLMGCGIPKLSQKTENKSVPISYAGNTDTINIATQSWRQFFTDPYLVSLIDTALINNQEMNILKQEIRIGNNEIMAKRGELFPSVNMGIGAGANKSAKYTLDGALEENVPIVEGDENPNIIPDYGLVFNTSWEVDIWRKLRNSRDAATARYLASIEGQNFMKTLLVQEVASSYYELLSLQSQAQIIQEYITLQLNALKTVKLQKEAGEVTQLAVQRFEGEVLKTKGLQFGINQRMIETENKLNYLLGRYPQPISTNLQSFEANLPVDLSAGVPSQLLEHRPDIKAAELNIIAANLDIKVAKAQFYPSLDISAGIGLQAFNPAFLATAPESMLYSVAGDLITPLLNRKAIKANYLTANSKQIQTIFNYQQTLLNAYIETYNQVSKLDNLQSMYDLKTQEVTVLDNAVSVSNDLFRSARADYMEVLMTQRDALDAKIELIEIKEQQFLSMISLYKACGGGWK